MKYALRILTFVCLSFPLLFFTDASVVGDWELTIPTEDGGTATLKVSLKKDGTYTVDFEGDGSIEIKGEYQLDGNQMTIKDVSGPNYCNGKGVYTVEVKDDKLTMTRVSDQCEGRGGPEGVMVMQRAS